MSDWLALGRFGRPHGVRGAIRFWPFNPDTQVVGKGKPARIGTTAEGARTLTVSHVRRDAKGLLVSFDGVADRDEVGALNGLMWFIERGSLPPTGEDEFYFVDLFGKPVRTEDGHDVGILVDVMDGPAAELLVIQGPNGKTMVPNVDVFVKTLDPAAPAVVITPIPGLVRGVDEE